jgi:hypothetical protein
MNETKPLTRGDDGFWRAGPWADPSTDDGIGGVIELLQKALGQPTTNGA